MITYVKGDLFTDKADALVNAVNTVGVMGKGLAYQFKERYPDNFAEYYKVCKSGNLSVGEVFTFKLECLESPKYIINFPTKAHWRGKSKIEYIEEGIKALITSVEEHSITSVAIPALGSGLGGLPWSQVEKVMLEKLSNVQSVDWRIYAPNDAPPSQKKLRMTFGRAALIVAISLYSSRKKQISEQEIQCLIYLLQCRGLQLGKLEFDEYRNAPFSSVLHTSLKKMDGHFLFLSGINKSAEATLISLDSNYLTEAKVMLKNDAESGKKIKDVMSVVAGYESNEGMSIIATTVWIVANQNENFKYDEPIDSLVDKYWDQVSKLKGASKGIFKGTLSRLYDECWFPK